MILLNFIFFIPKRKVSIEFSPAKNDFPRQGTRKEINDYLEAFFNRGFGPSGEPLQRVPIYFWKAKYIPNEYHIKCYHFDSAQIPSDILQDVRQKIANLTKRPLSEINPALLIDRDLSLDSIEIADLLTELEQRYKMPKYVPKNVSSVAHLAALAAGIPVEYVPIRGEFPVIHEEPAIGVKAWQVCSTAFVAFLGLLHLHK